ncbi:hypothetical protein B0H39_003434 [Clostridium beijerinckii]|uniref:hypothetical protein n=1 Tax=Clostridium beijerinckii TaxID=1520 RepID=UPI001493EF10|nr:hypothetical protein [Clostridium beijerinckii]NOW85553.1 hypothetical protein [Clostridium beijerinckii]
MNKIKSFKRYIVDVTIMSGLFALLKLFWDELEILFDGGIQESISDSIIAIVLVYILWQKIIKWIEIKSEVDQ